MIRIILLILFIALQSGCASLNQFGENTRKINHTVDAMYYRPNLIGLSKSEFLQDFMYPDSSSVSYIGERRVESWYYRELGEGRRMVITFTDDVITNVHYY